MLVGVRDKIFVAALAISCCLLSKAALADTLHVRDVALNAVSSDGSEIFVATSGKPHYSGRTENGGLRLILDLEDADVAGAQGAITKPAGVVAGVMTQAFSDGALKTTRLMVTLAKPAEYRVFSDAAGLRI